MLRILPTHVGIIHFIGIGGIGMSGIAEILHMMGYQIQGSDIQENANVKRLQGHGIPIFIGHSPKHLENVAVVVVSSDIRASNIELKEAREQQLPIIHRAQMLAELMRLKPAIAVAGSHGKTTTTSLLEAVLSKAGEDPTVVSGGIINTYGTNARLGSGEWIIVEADESDGSFIKLPATIAIVTNIDPEHMNYYPSFENLQEAFVTFVENLPFYGLGVICYDHPHARALLPRFNDRRTITYGFSPEADLQACGVEVKSEYTSFSLELSPRAQKILGHPQSREKPLPARIENLRVSLLGQHNVLNTLAVIAVALEMGVEVAALREGLMAFSGVKRRFTKVGTFQQATIIDDYAHHPVEIAAVLKTARQCSQGRVIAVVQPHRYSRLSLLFDDFAGCFEEADSVIIAPIYGAGEEPIEGLTHERLAEAIKARGGCEVITIQQESELAPLLRELLQPHDYVVCMGAGSITAWAQNLPEALTVQADDLRRRA